jgi:pyridoxal phosphate enzyme (YggS family)
MSPDIGARIASVRARITAAAARAGRDPASVTLIGISKTHPPAMIEAAVRAGLRDIGENRVQEAVPKIAALERSSDAPRWHLVGHLQTNKAAAALRHFDILHGVDSEHLGRALSARASAPVAVLLEVNVAEEQSKFGVPPTLAPRLAERLGSLPNLDLRGLMTVAPQTDDPEEVRPVFRALSELRDAIGLRDLSMGMTDDFEVAVEEGATFVRVGRAIFGARTP